MNLPRHRPLTAGHDGLTNIVMAGAEPMGLLDRVAETLTMLKGTFGGQGQTDEVPAAAPDLSVDVDARRAQLNELRTALTELATAMSADPGRMVNPGWRGRVEDIRFGATAACTAEPRWVRPGRLARPRCGSPPALRRRPGPAGVHRVSGRARTSGRRRTGAEGSVGVGSGAAGAGLTSEERADQWVLLL